jgi:cytochrome c-type biogenesis protein CcmE
MKTKVIVKTLLAIVVIGGGIAYFMYQAMSTSWSYYYSVDDFIVNTAMAQNHSLRIAGKVKEGTITRDEEKMDLSFALSGDSNDLFVKYGGSVPDNFVEGGEVVVEGRLDTQGVFRADKLMTKCESKYKAKVN